ncbi:glutamate--cysteine ligase [Streptomyces sp. NPDC006487]|uniref:carboxylate-amine ligase n=1 Tax=Streptomyces sp. NPDC006487 TaxID=3364748 RepID=UPI003684146E
MSATKTVPPVRCARGGASGPAQADTDKAARAAVAALRAQRMTLGVEEEFLLVDRVTRAPAGRAPQVIASATPALGPRVEPEFYTAQIEIHTDPVDDLVDLRRQLTWLRRELARAAAAHDCLLVATGTPPIPPEHPLTVTAGRRYQAMATQYAHVLGARDQVVSGCHVHVGVKSRAEALGIANRLGPWLPVLQAIAANSPYDRGRDSAHASWRAVEHARWPTVGPAPVLDEAAYERLAEGLVRDGLLLDRRMIYWYARPSEHVPTLEIRVADTNADLDTVILIAALVRGLAATVRTDMADHRPAPFPQPARLRAAHRLAAIDGLAGEGLDPCSAVRRPAWALVDRLRERIAPALDRHGDLDRVDALLESLRHTGGGAACQRHAFGQHHRLTDIVDDLARTTTGTADRCRPNRRWPRSPTTESPASPSGSPTTT